MKKWKVGWGTIASCNMKCEFCYSEKTRQNIETLQYKDWVEFIDNNHTQISEINYGTGENTLSDDWFEFVNYVRKNYPHILQALTTNGYLSEKISNTRYRKIIERSIDEIDISLDFCIPEEHNSWRGQKNAFRWAMDTLKFCQETGIKSTIVFIGTPKTLSRDNIKGIFQIGGENNAKLRMNLYRPTKGIENNSKKFIVSFWQIIDIMYFINDNYQILSICDPLFSSILTYRNYKNDPSGESSIRILADGSITPSTYLISEEFRKINIRVENALEQIENKAIFNEIFSAPVPQFCRKHNCKFIHSCKGGVYDRRYLWYGSFRERDPYCPYRYTHEIEFKNVEIAHDENFSSIHDGYLPTMFFKA